MTYTIPPAISFAQAQALTLASAVVSPSSATTVVQAAPLTGLGDFNSMLVYATLQGATGGTLDVYIQGSPDGGTTWVDLIHFPQLAAAAAAKGYIVQMARAGSSTAVPVLVNAANGTPALAANVAVPGTWGDRLRYVFVAGASTTAGAAQSILVSATY